MTHDTRQTDTETKSMGLQEAALILGVTYAGVRYLMLQGKLDRAHEVSGPVCVTAESVERLKAEREAAHSG